jgi:pimeloyl-ACP methyl ester carboxylesterase
LRDARHRRDRGVAKKSAPGSVDHETIVLSAPEARVGIRLRVGWPSEIVIVAMGMRLPVAEARQLVTSDGRRLRVEVAGDGSRVIVVQVGSPNAGLLYDRWVEDAAARGLTLVAYDRPGYGGSSRQPGRKVADCAADVRAISAAVGFDRCAVWGFSGGGPHALACGALLDDLVVAVATIGSPAPFDVAGCDYFAISDAAREDYELFLSDRAAWEREGEQQEDELLALSIEEFAEQWSRGKSAGDRAALHSGFGSWLYRAVQASVAPGSGGWTDDDIAVLKSSWGFDPALISVPVKVWHGLDDQFVSVAHGRWLAENIHGAQAELRSDDGHLTVAALRIGELHQWLAQRL